MNDKILITIIVPYLEEKYDLFIPKNKKIANVIILIQKMINEMSDGYYEMSNSASLIDRTTGIYYDISKTVKEENIENGTEIILI